MSKKEQRVEPLKSRTMTLNELQLRTMDVLRKVKFQLHRAAHQDGMSDGEFIDQVVDPLIEEIYQDRDVLRMHRARKRHG